MHSRRKLPGAVGVTGRRAVLLAALEDVFVIELVCRRQVIPSPRKIVMAQVLKMNDATCRAVIVSIHSRRVYHEIDLTHNN